MTIWKKQQVGCAHCGAQLMRFPFRPKDGAAISAFFCNTSCKGEWQRASKGVSREWLYQKYIVEGLSAVDIAKLVRRNSKRVWEWLRDYNIPTRPRGADERRHFKRGHKLGVGRKLPEARKQALRDARLKDGHYPKQEDGRAYWAGKTGTDHPSWRGGVTPERQAFYETDGWKVARDYTYKRANYKCERCNASGHSARLHVHHIMPFFIRSFRDKTGNLALLCAKCHRFVHSVKNRDRDFLPPIGSWPVTKNGITRMVPIGARGKRIPIKLPEWLKSA